MNSNTPEWDASLVYLEGHRVTFQGDKYTAAAGCFNVEPGTEYTTEQVCVDIEKGPFRTTTTKEYYRIKPWDKD